MAQYSDREIRLISKVPPDAWQVRITRDGNVGTGDLLNLEEALAEFAAALSEEQFDSIEIAPMWNTSWHENENS